MALNRPIDGSLQRFTKIPQLLGRKKQIVETHILKASSWYGYLYYTSIDSAAGVYRRCVSRASILSHPSTVRTQNK